jgi:phage-related protein
MKKIIFINKSLDGIKQFSQGARREAGHQLDRVQRGLDPIDYKPMSSVGRGVKEIRIKDAEGIYRVMYVAKFKGAVYVLHAFKKKTQKTSKQDISTAKAAFKKMLEEK